MAAELYGIEETKEVVTAMGDAAVVCRKAVKSVDETKPLGDQVQAFVTALVPVLMAKPQFIADFKAAFDNVGQVPSEIKDLSLLTEMPELAAHMALVIAASAKSVQE
jgi:hypothetical protein